MVPEVIRSVFPYFLSGRVVEGFGRGGKQLGCPTANLPDVVADSLPPEIGCGVYYGWATVDDGPVLGMVMSIGWNPQFKNTKKSAEAHILHKFDSDFYGSYLKLIIVGFLREMESFSSLEALKAAIKYDIDMGTQQLCLSKAIQLKSHDFFTPGSEKKEAHFNNSNQPIIRSSV